MNRPGIAGGFTFWRTRGQDVVDPIQLLLSLNS